MEFTPQLLLRAESVADTGAQAYFYRKRTDSITTGTGIRKTVKRLEDTRKVIAKLLLTADTMPPIERQAMQRRVAQLTMDYIYGIIIQTGNRHYLERKIDFLRRSGLFPLPHRQYTMKYRWFRRLSSTYAGRTLLMRILPLMNKER